jgi:hypothetical protein
MATTGWDTCDTTSAMDVCTHRDMPSTGPQDNWWLPPVAQSSGTIQHSSPSVSPVNQSTSCALHHFIQDASSDVKHWHGSRHPEYALDRIEEFSNNNLTSLGLDDTYYDAILKSHEQIMSSLPCCREHMDNCCFDEASAIQAALEHPAWDHLIDTSPEGWMEFYQSLHHNAMTFYIAPVPFEGFNMLYHEKWHGLCLCSLGIRRYCSMGCALFAVLQTLMP